MNNTNFKILLSKNNAFKPGKESRLNGNVLVVGASGYGKTKYVEKNLQQHNANFVINDRDGSVLKNNAEALRKSGYNIKILNLKNAETSQNHYNPLKYFGLESDILMLAKTLRENIQNNEDDLFFSTHINKALTEVLLFAKADNLTIAEMQKKIINTEYKIKCIDTLSSKTIAAITTFVIIALEPFATDDAIKITSDDNIELDLFGDKKTALFVVASPDEYEKNIIAACLYRQLMSILLNKKTEFPTRFMFDEFDTMAHISNLPEYMTINRKHNVGIDVITPSISAFNHYNNEEINTILANCDTKLFLGGKDEDTANHVSFVSEFILDPAKYQQLDKNKCIIIQRNKEAIIDEKV